MQRSVRFDLNHQATTVDVDDERKLLWILRNDLGLTGAKYGCGAGLCGACTVVVDGFAVRSCITPIAAVEGKKVVTIEGLAKGGELHPLQRAFVDHGAFQCGYCTSGMILSAFALLGAKSNPTRQEILDGMERNLCRCGAHARIVAAIESAAHAPRSRS